jgi:hypothetical protein
MATKAVFGPTSARTAQRHQDSRPEHGSGWFVSRSDVAAGAGFGPSNDLAGFSLVLDHRQRTALPPVLAVASQGDEPLPVGVSAFGR